MNEYLAAIILGIVEGITEFLPISSTGHLILAGHAIGFTDERAKTFEVIIQLGAILAVVYLYFPRFLGLIPTKHNTGGLKGWRGIIAIGLACAPAFVLGALFSKQIKHYLFYPGPVGWALVLGGIAMILIESRNRPPELERLDDITWFHAFWIGVFQCLALWPGMSRSASTMIGALLIGVHRRAGAEFSFLVAVPVMCAATAHDLFENYRHLSLSDVPMFLTGFVVSFIVAVAAIRTFLAALGGYTGSP
jgi:undecaprenyl-diphosphatase